MSDLCEHETFRDVCPVCYRGAVIDNLRAKLERLCDAAQAVIRVADRATIEFDGLKAAIASAHTDDKRAHSAFANSENARLRERVAMAMKLAADDNSPVRYWYVEAAAAIALIRGEALEEAARVADGEYGYCEETGSPPSDFGNAGRNEAAQTIAAAIRAMKSKP